MIITNPPHQHTRTMVAGEGERKEGDAKHDRQRIEKRERRIAENAIR